MAPLHHSGCLINRTTVCMIVKLSELLYVNTSFAEHWYIVPKLYMYNLEGKKRRGYQLQKGLSAVVNSSHVYTHTYTQVPLQTDFGLFLKPKNGIYVKVINRT